MEKATQIIARHEGLRLAPYKDSVGKLTVGYGHNIDDLGISQAVADVMLKEDVNVAYHDAYRFDWFAGLDGVRRAVVINMVFNLGLPRFTGFKKTIALIERGDYWAASQEMLDSKWAEQVGSRAIELSEMMQTGQWPNGES